MLTSKTISRFIFLSIAVATVPAWSHDPVFGLGPHVLFKGGIEISPQYLIDSAGDRQVDELGLQLTYGLTGDWAAGVEIPYVKNTRPMSEDSGQGDISVFTKYRFWRKDGLGEQRSLAVNAKLKTDSGANGVGTGTTDGILGIAYGYEGRKWYHWAAVRHRFNGENNSGLNNGLRRGNKTLVDLVGGIRPKQTSYLEPDTVWLLELNGEFTQRAELNGTQLANTGGSEWFVSPGIFWTLRNFAVKAGVQIPVMSDLNERQDKTDYRARLILEWHL